MRNKIKFLITIFLISLYVASTIFFVVPASSSSSVADWSTETAWNEGWTTNSTLRNNWQIRNDPKSGEYGDTDIQVNTSDNFVRLQAKSNSSTGWYGIEIKSKTQLNLLQKWRRITYMFNAPSMNSTNKYAFSFAIWNGTFGDAPNNYAIEMPYFPNYFRIETLNETHANFQGRIVWNQTSNPLPYTGLTNVTWLIKQDGWSVYYNNTEYGTGYSGGTASEYNSYYVYMSLEAKGNYTDRYIDFYSIEIQDFVEPESDDPWAYKTYGGSWSVSAEPVLRPSGNFTIFNDPSIIEDNDVYYMAHSATNSTNSMTYIRNSSDCFSWSEPMATLMDSVKPWLSTKQDDGYYYIFYTVGGGHINRSRSTDLINWQQLSRALSPTPNDWDASVCGAPYLIKVNSTWYIFYYGSNTTYPVDKIGFATGTSLNGTFTKYANNPVITPSYFETFVPEFGVLSSTIINASDGYYYNFYNTISLSALAPTEERGIMGISVARSKNLTEWEKWGYPIIFPSNQGWDWKVLVGSAAFITIEEKRYFFVNCFNYSQYENIGYFYSGPQTVEVTISNMEGCGNWVFAQEKYYTFVAKYWDPDGYDTLDTMKIRFTDGTIWVTAVYESSTEVWSLESGGNITRIKTGSTSVIDEYTLQVIFPIYFGNLILDAWDVDLYSWCDDEDGNIDGWDLIAESYFNIYNVGGKANIEISRNAGQLVGGDVFDLYAYNNSYAESQIVFRNLVHAKLLPLIMITNQEEATEKLYLEYYMDYCTTEEDWITGWKIKLGLITAYSGSSHWANWTANWYFQDVLIKSEIIYTYHERTGDAFGENVTFRMWIDLWFNKVNASSTFGGRVNAYYFPMKDSSHAWLRWLTGSNWGIDDAKKKQSMFFDALRDTDGDIVYASQIKMVRLGCKLSMDQSNFVQYGQVSEYDVFDLTFGGDPLEGIQTPFFDETKVPIMPQGGFLGWLGSMFSGVFEFLKHGLSFIALNLWQRFVDFIDTICAFFGYPKAFSNFLDMLGAFWNWMGSAFNYIFSFLTSIFSFLAAIMTKFLNTVSNVITTWITVIQGVFSALGTGLNTGYNIWEDFNLSTWVTIIAILYPVYLFILWDQKGLDAVINQLRFLMDVAAWLVRIFITVIQMAIRLITTIIELIPVIE